jgi:hypothetical protein
VEEEIMTDEEIRALWMQSQNRITELLLQVAALQTLLQQAGHFSKADVEQRIEEIRTFWAARYQQNLAEWLEKDTHEQLRRLLESYEGTKQ